MELQSVSTQLAVEPGALEVSAPLDRLGDEIAELAAHLTVATARLLNLIREFDGPCTCIRTRTARCGSGAD